MATLLLQQTLIAEISTVALDCKGNVIIGGNFNLNVGSTTTNGTITCSSPPTYNVNVSTNYTNSGALNQKGSVLLKGSVGLPGTGSNISGSA